MTFENIEHLIFRSTADVNCLYNPHSMLLSDETLGALLRIAVFIELLLYINYYGKLQYVTQKTEENPEHHKNLILTLFFETKLQIYRHLEKT